MNKKNMYIFTQTPMHVGAGNEVGVIDNPIQRDKITSCPVIPGSSIKGVFRRECSFGMSETDVDLIFGSDDEKKLSAGRLAFTEASLLLFPLRSMKNAYAYATSPFLLKRFFAKSGFTFKHKIEDISPAECIAPDSLLLGKKVVLEEYSFDRINNNELLEDISKLISGILPSACALNDLQKHLVILSDEDMFYLAQYSCPVQQHVRIGDDGVAAEGALFNIETIPSDTLMYSVLISEESDIMTKFSEWFGSERLLQFGSDSTTGLGYSVVAIDK